MRKFWLGLIAGFHRGHRFVMHDVWQVGLPGEEVPSGFIIKHVRVAILLVQGTIEEALLLRSSALTFSTLLFIVPFLWFMLTFIQTFNLGDQVYALLSQKLDQKLSAVLEFARLEQAPDPDTAEADEKPAAESSAPADAPRDPAAAPDAGGKQKPVDEVNRPPEQNRELWRHLLTMMFPGWQQRRTPGSDTESPVEILVNVAEKSSRQPGALGITSLIYVLSTIFGLMRNVEWSFNRIWGVSSTRSIVRTISDYLMITMLLPFVAAGVLGITAAMENEQILQALGPFAIALRGIQLAVICLTFSMLYLLVPNTRVMFRYALLGGIVAGILWTLVSWGYVKFQFGLARYTLFFSTFALFPLMLMWIYSSWIILLFGALLAFAYQNEKTFAIERLSEGASYAYREALAVRTMVEMTRRFRKGLPGLSVAEAAVEWNVPSRLLNETLDFLVGERLVSLCATQPVTYQPARAPETTTVLDVIHAVREAGKAPSLLRQDLVYRKLYKGVEEGDMAYLGATMSDVAIRLEQEALLTSETAAL